MTDKNQLAAQVEGLTAWKQSIAHEISRYRTWLSQQGLESGDVNERLSAILKSLRTDRILLAFVGEFSRGKSELINALLGKHYGQRLLPTRIGRTTMCPTELFYDATATGAYIKLLPIRTRAEKTPLAEYKEQLEHWVHLTINLDDPQAMKKAFTEVSQTKEVSQEEAAGLGFDVDYLEPSLKENGFVHIPAWRHAIINIDHPLLRQGLAIIDTPGLNALGAEPELTLSLLPDAQALVFVMSADTGVTASDFSIWSDHIQDIAHRRGAALYAVLNKIDLLWDEDEEPEHAEEAVLRLARLTAKQLHVEPENVMPISARQGFKARLANDKELLARSRMEFLEAALARSIVKAKASTLNTTVLTELSNMVESSRQSVLAQCVRLQAEERVHASGNRETEHEVIMLTRLVQQDQATYNKRLALLQQSRKLVEQQLPRLLGVVSPARRSAHAEQAQNQANSGQLGFGLPTAVAGFFQALRKDLQMFQQEVVATQGLLQKLYERYTLETGSALPPMPVFSPATYLQELDELEQQAAPYKNRFGNLLASKQRWTERFFETVAREAGNVHDRACKEAEHWCKQALAPLMQQTLEYKKRLAAQMEKLNKLRTMGDDHFEKNGSLKEQREMLQEQQNLLEDILASLKVPAFGEQEQAA